MKSSLLNFTLLSWTLNLTISSAFAQPIIPAKDGTETQVMNNGDQFNIDGGSLSGDGQNLFHSFEQFGLNSGQIANFISTPEIQNILGRIVGRDPSIINGLIQVTGGQSNLFLMNPAGFIFGSGASLNLPGDFTVTTANKIGFEQGWFRTFESNDYQALVGHPNQFYFNLLQEGTIINDGKLSVPDGKNITLLGGNIINTGTISTPGGNITLTAVNEGNSIRISQEGYLLSLEIPIVELESGNLSPLDLPLLLTGNLADLTVPPDSATTLISGNLDTSSEQMGGQINIFGERVGLFSANIDTSGIQGGGNIRIGGDYQGQGQVPLASQTFVDTNTIIQANSIAAGDGGQVIVWSDGTTQFAGNISATGGSNRGDGGFAEVSGKQTLLFQGSADLTSPTGKIGTLLLDPTNITISNSPNASSLILFGGVFNDTFTSPSNLNVVVLENQLALSDVTVSTASTLNDLGNITVGSQITWNSNTSLTLDADNDIVVNAPINATGNGSLTLQANQNITINANTPGNSIFIADNNGDGIGTLVLNTTNDIASDLVDSDTNASPNTPESDANVGANSALEESGEPSGEGGEQGSPGEPDGEGRDFEEPEDGEGRDFGESDGEDGEGDERKPRDEESEEEEDEKERPDDFESISREVDNNSPELSFLEETESNFTEDYQEHFGFEYNLSASQNDPSQILQEIKQQTDVVPSILYITFAPSTVSSELSNEQEITRKTTDLLELILVTPGGQPIRKTIEGVTRLDVLRMARRFRRAVSRNQQGDGYLESAQQLYNWLINPLETELQKDNINNINLIMDSGLRSLPIAALHDGEEFLIQRYSLGLMPSLSLTDTSRDADLSNTEVLAMGAAVFASQNPLPAVPIEIEVIADQLWEGQFFLNEDFTIEKLQQARQSEEFGIVHLATHGEFTPGHPRNSYIQFWDDKLRLDQIQDLRLNNPTTELLVLSACQTALGDPQAELGFAGLAIQAGVKSALGSLWLVSDQGTLGLMTSFYTQLKLKSTKTEALQQAQLAMIEGKVRLENEEIVTPRGNFPLPPRVGLPEGQDLSHPYYWSAFTLIGNPW